MKLDPGRGLEKTNSQKVFFWNDYSNFVKKLSIIPGFLSLWKMWFQACLLLLIIQYFVPSFLPCMSLSCFNHLVTFLVCNSNHVYHFPIYDKGARLPFLSLLTSGFLFMGHRMYHGSPFFSPLHLLKSPFYDCSLGCFSWSSYSSSFPQQSFISQLIPRVKPFFSF